MFQLVLFELFIFTNKMENIKFPDFLMEFGVCPSTVNDPKMSSLTG